MSVSSQHSAYSEHLNRWQRVRDCVEGEDAIKTRSRGAGKNSSSLWAQRGTAYLPPPNADDESAENIARYDSYRERAVFTNYTGSTLVGLKGMVFRKPPVVELPLGLEYLLEDANNEGLNVAQMMQKTLDELCITGGDGLLAEYPQAEQGLTKAEIAARGLRAYIKRYKSESILNWREEFINGKKQLALVVLCEEVDEIDLDGFDSQPKKQYRVLSLSEGVYIQRLFNEDKEQILIDGEEFIVPRKADGSPWSHIPFKFVGSENNDSNPDKALLLDIANVNIAHYRNSADKEEASFITGQPTLTISGLTQSWVQEVLKGKVLMGSRGGIPLPEGASAQLLQASANPLPSQGMKDKEQEMVALGARIIRDVKGNETAEAAKIRFSGQNSLLSIAVNNIEEAYLSVVKWVAMFMGEPEESISIQLNREFYDSTIDPQLIAQLFVALDRGALSMDDIRWKLRSANLISPETMDEDIDDELEGIDPLA